MRPIRVMIVDDSATVRQVLAGLIGAEPDMTVVGVAADPLFALDKMNRDWPDVVVLDLEMPRMDGLTFLKKIMAERPTPVVICSTLTGQGTDGSLQALAAGAVEVVAKPRLGLRQFLLDAGGAELVRAVRAAGCARVGHPARGPAAAPARPAAEARPSAPRAGADQVVAVGTSTGGTLALERLLGPLPATVPGMVIVQHMPEKFTAAFARRLDGLCRLEVREAADGDRLLPGRALIAPGGRHMLLRRAGAGYLVEVVDGPPVNRHRPSVDVLFRSVARCAGPHALGIIMTGMGDDGARGLKEMREAGARTLAQDEASCVVYGMPKEAVRMGAAAAVLTLDGLAGEIVGWAGARGAG